MRKIFYCLLAAICLYACKDSGREASGKSENPVDAARNFIRAALDGDYDKAKTYMKNDSLNQEDLSTIERLNERLSPEEKERYHDASIRIYETRHLDDSTSVIYYSNSYRNIKDSLRVIRAGDEWLVDFKFIFHKTESQP